MQQHERINFKYRGPCGHLFTLAEGLSERWRERIKEEGGCRREMQKRNRDGETKKQTERKGRGMLERERERGIERETVSMFTCTLIM